MFTLYARATYVHAQIRLMAFTPFAHITRVSSIIILSCLASAHTATTQIALTSCTSYLKLIYNGSQVSLRCMPEGLFKQHHILRRLPVLGACAMCTFVAQPITAVGIR